MGYAVCVPNSRAALNCSCHLPLAKCITSKTHFTMCVSGTMLALATAQPMLFVDRSPCKLGFADSDWLLGKPFLTFLCDFFVTCAKRILQPKTRKRENRENAKTAKTTRTRQKPRKQRKERKRQKDAKTAKTAKHAKTAKTVNTRNPRKR